MPLKAVAIWSSSLPQQAIARSGKEVKRWRPRWRRRRENEVEGENEGKK